MTFRLFKVIHMLHFFDLPESARFDGVGDRAIVVGLGLHQLYLLALKASAF